MLAMGRRTGFAAATVLALAGCSTVASSDLRTSGMTARIFVTATDSGISVGTDLTAGGTTSVELRPGDSLVARSSGRQQTLQETTVLGLHSYAAVLPTTTAPGTEVAVDLLRSHDAAAGSSVQLPGRVGLRAPASGASVSRGHDLPVRVAPGPGVIRVDWQGSCVSGGEVRFEEGQPIVLPAGSIQQASPPSPGATVPDRCEVTLTVSRVLEGRLASAYKGGFIEGVRTQAVLVRSVP